MSSPRHGFEQVRRAQAARLVIDAIPTLAWSAGIREWMEREKN